MDLALESAIKRALRPSLVYWWCSDDIDQTDTETTYDVEIRINVAAGCVGDVTGISDWTVVKRDRLLEAVFLRRRQALDKVSIEGLIRDGVTIAYAHSGQF